MKIAASLAILAFSAVAAFGQTLDMGQIEDNLGANYFKSKEGQPVKWLFSDKMKWSNATAPETAFSVSKDGKDGANCLKIACPPKGLYAVYFQLDPPKAGSDYMIKFWAKGLTPNARTQVLYELRGDKHFYKSQDIELTNDWKQYEVLVQIPKLGTEYFKEGKDHDLRFRLWSTTNGSTVANEFLVGNATCTLEGASCE